MRCDGLCSSIVKTSSAHTPVAFTTTRRGDRERRRHRGGRERRPRRTRPRRVVDDVDAAHVGGDDRAEVERGGLGEGERDARVVAASVVVEEARDEAIDVERREVREHLVARDPFGVAVPIRQPPLRS